MPEFAASVPAPLVVGVSALVAFLLIGLVRRYAIQHQILAHPGPRASHTRPTPRGGGLGLIAAVLLTVLALRWQPGHLSLLVALGGITLTALVGWLDDRRSLGVRSRLLAHVAAGATLLPLALWPAAVPAWMGPLAGLWWVFWAVSAINVVNFMDGIDGLIGSQALIFGVHLALGGRSAGLAEVIGLGLAGASAGFLLWNWPPARVFLGDVGSGALGLVFVLGGLALLQEGTASLVTAFLPLYPLFLDATVTLLRRLRRGERISEAHRSHLYQRLANGSWGHARVTLLYGAAAIAALPTALLPIPLRMVGIPVYLFAALVLGWLLDRRVETQ